MASDISQSLRDFVKQRANDRCEYCLIPDVAALHPHEIEQILPRKHSGESISENLAWGCWRCNRHKGTDFGSIDSETGSVTLFFNPRTQIWIEHFSLDGTTIRPLTAEARVTLRIFRLNDAQRIEEQRELTEANLYP